jgi:GTP-binding protein HflX
MKSETNQTQKEVEKAFLMGVIFNNKDDVIYSLNELERLAESAGLVVVGKDYQLVRTVTPATLIGSGKVLELKEQIIQSGANVVIFDYELSNSQIKNLTDILEVKVLDRIGLILDIFALRATSLESKLQVELAQLKYSLPRLSSLVGTSGKFGAGGVGMRGPGETKLELDRRVVENKIVKLERELLKVKEQRLLKRKQRRVGNKKNVAIVGYTNAGKSTLLNVISKAGVYADDKLFATLDTTSRSVWLSPDLQIILTDTVGFISKLPHTLIDAFASTLEETLEADLILHLVDATNKNYEKQIEVVNDTLKKIGAENIPQIIVYNKSDILEKFMKKKTNNNGIINIDDFKNKGGILKNKGILKDEGIYEDNEITDENDELLKNKVLSDKNEIFISAKKNINIDKLKNKICDFFTK